MTRVTVAITILAVLVAGAAVYYSIGVASELRQTEEELAAAQRRASDSQSALAGELEELRKARRKVAAEDAGLVASAAPAEEERAEDPAGKETGLAAADAERAKAETVGDPSRDAVFQRFHEATGKAREEALGAISDLAKLGDEEAVELLVEALADEDPGVRDEAMEALGNLADPALLPHLAPSVEDPDPEIREELAGALAKLPPSKAAGPLLAKLLADENPDVVEEALEAVGAMRYREVLPQVREQARTGNPDVAAEAGAVLRSLGDDEAADAALRRVAAGLQSPDPFERLAAVDRVKKVGGQEAIRYLERALEDESGVVRERARKALQKLAERS